MTGGWVGLALAFALFLATHGVPARPAVRRWLVGGLGERGYLCGIWPVPLLAEDGQWQQEPDTQY